MRSTVVQRTAPVLTLFLVWICAGCASARLSSAPEHWGQPSAAVSLADSSLQVLSGVFSDSPRRRQGSLSSILLSSELPEGDSLAASVRITVQKENTLLVEVLQEGKTLASRTYTATRHHAGHWHLGQQNAIRSKWWALPFGIWGLSHWYIHLGTNEHRDLLVEAPGRAVLFVGFALPFWGATSDLGGGAFPRVPPDTP